MSRISDAPNTAKYLDGHRQLRVLTRAPSEKDHRPLFHYDSLSDEEMAASPAPPYRVLRWHPVEGTEVCAYSPGELAEFDRAGYVAFPPNQTPVTINAAIKDELDGLTTSEREAVLEAAAVARRAALTEKLSRLSEADLASVSARGPGRPRKG